MNSRAIANSYKNIFNVSELESIELAKFTKGYAFAYQVLGNILYESGKNKIDSSVIELFDEILQERAYNIIYNELTNKEKELINYSIIDNSNSYILNKMNIASNQLSNYKKALVNKGLLEPDRNKIIIKLPRFKEFISFISNYKL